MAWYFWLLKDFIEGLNRIEGKVPSLEACFSWQKIPLFVYLKTYGHYLPFPSHFLEGQQPRAGRIKGAEGASFRSQQQNSAVRSFEDQDFIFGFTGPSDLIWRTHLPSMLPLETPSLLNQISASFSPLTSWAGVKHPDRGPGSASDNGRQTTLWKWLM